jgi:hypothetical protein
MGDGRSGSGRGGAARRTLARLLDDCVGIQEGGRIGRPGLDLGDCFHEFSFTKFGCALDTQFAGQSLELGDAKGGQA